MVYIDRIRNPYRYGHYTVKRYRLKNDAPIKLTYFKKAVRESGWEKAKRVEVIDFQEPYYIDDECPGLPIYFKPSPKDRIYKFEQELKEHQSYDYKLDKSLIRSRTKMFEYALCNEFDYFVTLTINPELHDRYDLKSYKKKLGEFIHGYKRRHAADIKYALVPEFHEDGAVHMHGLISGIPEKDLKKNEYGYLDWTPYSKRFGYFSCSPIRDYERCAKYVTKYITKELQSMPKGSQVILCSKGLKTAEIVSQGYDETYDIENADFENDFVKVAWVNE